MRFLIYLFLAYIAYRIFKSVIRPREHEEISPGEVIDEMVRCSLCETYIPRREAIKKTADGELVNFCSETCADRYAQLKGQSDRDAHG
jgi:hypothetical protein